MRLTAYAGGERVAGKQREAPRWGVSRSVSWAIFNCFVFKPKTNTRVDLALLVHRRTLGVALIKGADGELKFAAAR